MSIITADNLRPRVTGDTWPIKFTFLDESGAAVDITGYAFTLTVDPNENPASSATNIFTAVAGTIVSATAGSFQFALTAPQAALLVRLANDAAYWAWVKVTDASGKSGTAKMRLPVTGGPG